MFLGALLAPWNFYIDLKINQLISRRKMSYAELMGLDQDIPDTEIIALLSGKDREIRIGDTFIKRMDVIVVVDDFGGPIPTIKQF